MFTYAQVDKKLSKNIQTILSDANTFSEFEPDVAKRIEENTGIIVWDDSWMAQPAAWIIEYYASSRLGTITDVYQKRIETNYKEAFEILDRYSTKGKTKTPVTAQVVAMEGLYDANF